MQQDTSQQGQESDCSLEVQSSQGSFQEDFQEETENNPTDGVKLEN